MTRFLVELRLHGYAKSHAKELIFDVSQKFHVKGVTKNRAIPHITLYGPGETDDLKKVVLVIEKVGGKYDLVEYKINGFESFNNPTRVISLNIVPSERFRELRWELSQELRKVSSCQKWDTEEAFNFHSTVAFRDIDSKFDKIWAYIISKEKPDINQYLLRITLLGTDRRIICEYDCILKRLLNRRESLDTNIWRLTINGLRDLQNQSFNSKPDKSNWYRRLFNWIREMFDLKFS